MLLRRTRVAWGEYDNDYWDGQKQRNLAKDYTLGAVSKQSVVVPKSPSPLLEKIGLGPDDQLVHEVSVAQCRLPQKFTAYRRFRRSIP